LSGFVHYPGAAFLRLVKGLFILRPDTGVRFTKFGFCMTDVRRSDHPAPNDELPDEIYIGFVDGLLTDIVPIVLLSAVAVACGELAAAIAAKSLILALTAPAQLLIAAIRLQLAKRHARNIPSPTVAIARMREKIFWAGAVVSLTALSLWTLLAFCVTDNNFAHFTGVSMPIAYPFRLIARSYAT